MDRDSQAIKITKLSIVIDMVTKLINNVEKGSIHKELLDVTKIDAKNSTCCSPAN